jgi:hypothetical protein
MLHEYELQNRINSVYILSNSEQTLDITIAEYFSLSNPRLSLPHRQHF